MNVITLEEEAFYELVGKVVAEVKKQLTANPGSKWLDDAEAMAMLKIKSKTTLQELRDRREIRFSQPKPKTILYDADSINEYLDRHAKDTIYGKRSK